MNIVIVDDEEVTLKLLGEALRDIFFDKQIKCDLIDAKGNQENIYGGDQPNTSITIELYVDPVFFVDNTTITPSDFVVVDFNMAPINGLETIQRVIDKAKRLDIPLTNFVLFTGNAKHLPPYVEKKLEELGVCIISKGCQDALFEKIEQLPGLAS